MSDGMKLGAGGWWREVWGGVGVLSRSCERVAVHVPGWEGSSHSRAPNSFQVRDAIPQADVAGHARSAVLNAVKLESQKSTTPMVCHSLIDSQSSFSRKRVSPSAIKAMLPLQFSSPTFRVYHLVPRIVRATLFHNPDNAYQ